LDVQGLPLDGGDVTRRKLNGTTIQVPGIHRRKDGRYVKKVAVELLGGTTKRLALYGATEAEVAQQCVILEAEVNRNGGVYVPKQRKTKTVENPETTLSGMFNQVLEHRMRKLQPGTVEDYRYTFDRYIAPVLGGKNITELKPDDISKFYADLSRKGLTRTVKLVHFLIESTLNYAVNRELLQRNPVALIDPPDYQEREIRYWEPEEVRQVLDQVKQDGDELVRSIVHTLLGTGLRSGEVFALRWDALDLEKGKLHVRHSLRWQEGKPIWGPPKTRASRRTLQLPSDVVDMLKARQGAQKLERAVAGDLWINFDSVFAGPFGKPILSRTFADWFKVLGVRAKVKEINVHGTRHTYASLCIRSEMQPKLLSELLGHTNVAFTLNKYAHVFEEMRVKAAVPLDDLLTKIATSVADDTKVIPDTASA
jgi:integrase